MDPPRHWDVYLRTVTDFFSQSNCSIQFFDELTFGQRESFNAKKVSNVYT